MVEESKPDALVLPSARRDSSVNKPPFLHGRFSRNEISSKCVKHPKVALKSVRLSGSLSTRYDSGILSFARTYALWRSTSWRTDVSPLGNVVLRGAGWTTFIPFQRKGEFFLGWYILFFETLNYFPEQFNSHEILKQTIPFYFVHLVDTFLISYNYTV